MLARSRLDPNMKTTRCLRVEKIIFRGKDGLYAVTACRGGHREMPTTVAGMKYCKVTRSAQLYLVQTTVKGVTSAETYPPNSPVR